MARTRAHPLSRSRWASPHRRRPRRPRRPRRSRRRAEPRGAVRDGHGGAGSSTAPGTSRADPKRMGLRQGWQRRASLEGWTPVEVPHSGTPPTSRTPASAAASAGTARTSASRAPAGRALARALRVRELPRGRVAQRPAYRRPRGAYVPFEVLAERASRTGVNRLVLRVSSSARTRTCRRPASSRTAARAAGGGTTAGSCARCTCAPSTGWTSRNCSPARACAAAPATRRCSCAPPCAATTGARGACRSQDAWRGCAPASAP